MSRPKTAPQTLCEPAQSKRMSRFSYSVGWFMRETIAPKTMQAEIAYGVYRWLWHQAKRRHDKRRPEVERREPLCARLRASQSELRRWTAQNEDIHVVRACAVKTQSRFHKSHFRRKITRKMPRPKTAPQTLCEPRQSKRMSRFSYSVGWFMRETIAPKTMQAERAYGVYRWLWHQAKRRRDKRRPEVERRETLCARLRASQNEPRRRTAQNADIHVKKNASLRSQNVKQSRFQRQEPLIDTENYRETKMPRPHAKLHRRLCASLCAARQSKRMSRFSYSVSWFMRETIAPKTMQAERAYGVYRWLWHQAKRRHDKRRPEVERREPLCARLRASQSELRRRTAQNADIHVVRACEVKTQLRFHKSHFNLYGKLQEKCRGLKLHRRLCASLGSRNACQDLTRATLYRNF